jgi:hypothetical protein
MHTTLLNSFEKLKNATLQKAGIALMSPSNCIVLADCMDKQIGKKISETTVKRVYGFAKGHFNPSLFTLNAFAEFCGYRGWVDYFENCYETHSTTNQNDAQAWSDLKRKTDAFTRRTLQILKNRSGIPYNYTIARKSVNKYLNEFAAHSSSAAALIAPLGYGKTIGLCHWIEEKLEQNSPATNDLFLLVTSSALNNNSDAGRSLIEWLFYLLNYDDANDLISLKGKRAPGNFYLIIDDFDEHRFGRGSFRFILAELVDVLALYRKHSWFKVILTLRSDTYTNYHSDLMQHPEDWYLGMADSGEIENNVKLFNKLELDHLISKTPLILTPKMGREWFFKKLCQPLYFQLYYLANANKVKCDQLDHRDIYRYLSAYILNKIYAGPLLSEKLMLVKGLLREIAIKRKFHIINKLNVNLLIQSYADAYFDLLRSGYLIEQNTTNGLKPASLIRFGNNEFLEHAIALVVMRDHGYKLDHKVIDVLQHLLKDNDYVETVVSWCSVYAADHQNTDGRHQQAKVNFFIDTKPYLKCK